ncbi:amidase signature enzyme [Neoconidiobolus thromboides FSU 785]|nr:amidase signature enzyme [Neoconidiobolus thromboides FSU 785]
MLKALSLYFLLLLSSSLTAQTNSTQTDVSQLDINTRLCHGQDIYELTIRKAHNLYQTNKLSPSQLVECYLQRISILNPYLNAIIETNPSAIQEAKDIKSFDLNKFPLLGIPILIKDNIAVNGMNTTAGSNVLLATRPKDEAKLVKKLRQAGAIILAKANLSEFAGFRDFTDVSGWSGRGGQTRNAYVLSATASGSSSGPAVGIASNLAIISIGTETDGSLICPASLAATFGFKPTVGRVSTKGIIPLSPTQDSPGPITRNMEDLITVSSVMFEKDNEQISKLIDNGTSDTKEGEFTIGILRNPYFDSEAIRDQITTLNTTINKLKGDKQLKIVDNLTIDASKIDPIKEFTMISYEFKHYINEYLSNSVTGESLNLSKIIEYNNKNNSTELNLYKQGLLLQAETTSNLNDPNYIQAKQENVKAAKDAIDTILLENKLDVLLVPSDFNLGAFSPAAVAGYPIITIPLDVNKEKIPFGMSLYTTAEKDVTLLRVAKLLSSILDVKRATPKFISCCTSIDLAKKN